ncbi:unnamed protein product [Toxocara canis]|uniref:PPE family protein n=1 Tax=Toxocara canis TaxID=6265 RepID=A0A183U3I9_TOXCA|nr:unnamed protein product [Toxocara canis]
MSPTGEALCDRLKNFAFESPHSPALPANESLADAIAEHVQLVQAIIGSELGEASLRDLLDPVGWLDAQTIYAFLEAVAASAAIAVVAVQPYIWMFRLIAGRPTTAVAFDSTPFRLVIYNTITTAGAELGGSAVAHTTHTTDTPERDTVSNVRGNAKLTPSSTSRTRAGRKRRGASVEGIGTPKRPPTRTCARKIVAPENALTSAARKRFRAASALLPPSFGPAPTGPVPTAPLYTSPKKFSFAAVEGA